MMQPLEALGSVVDRARKDESLPVPLCPDCGGELVFKSVCTTMGTLNGWACTPCGIVTQRFGSLDAVYDVKPDVVQASMRPLNWGA